MANRKIDRIDKEILKTREKISEYQNKLRSLEAQKAEAENLQIVQLVRAMHLTPAELSALLSSSGVQATTPRKSDTSKINVIINFNLFIKILSFLKNKKPQRCSTPAVMR